MPGGGIENKGSSDTGVTISKMTRTTKTTKITVPDNQADLVRAYIEQLNLNAQTATTSSNDNDNTKQATVRRVVNHRVGESGEFEFSVEWVADRTREWVADDDCNCEGLISKYLAKNNINTAHLVCRVSTPDQAKCTNISLDAQEKELRNVLSDYPNLTRVKVHRLSTSAYKQIPTILKNLAQTTIKGDVIMAWRVDRLSRNLEEFVEWSNQLTKSGVGLYSHSEGITYDDNKTQFLQEVINAQREAEVLGQRVRLAYKMKRERGDERVGGLPYGKAYKRVDGGRMVVVDHPVESEVIARIVRSKSMSSRMAKELNKSGVFKRGRKWTAVMVGKIRRSNIGKKNK